MLKDFQKLVDGLVRDTSGKIAPADRDDAIKEAVTRYGKDRPREIAEDVAAPGGKLLSLPPTWQADFSELRSVEHPIGSFPPNLLLPEEISWYRDPAGLKIMLSRSIAAAQSVRLTFTIPHVVDNATDTIPAKDREPVCSWAAALLLDQLAAYFAGIADTTIQADVVDRRSKTSEYASRAKDARKRYYDELGIDPKRNVAAGVVVDLDSRDSQGNDRLLHPRRFN